MITHHNIIPAACAQQNERRHFHSGKIGQCPEQIMSFRNQDPQATIKAESAKMGDLSISAQETPGIGRKVWWRLWKNTHGGEKLYRECRRNIRKDMTISGPR